MSTISRKKKSTLKKCILCLFFSLIGILASLGLFSGYSENLILGKEEDGQPIVIDKETSEAFILPYDGDSAYEPDLPVEVQKYIQNKQHIDEEMFEQKIGEIQLPVSKMIPSGITSSASDVVETEDGNFMFLETRSYTPEAPYKERHQYNVVLVNKQGDILKQVELKTGKTTGLDDELIYGTESNALAFKPHLISKLKENGDRIYAVTSRDSLTINGQDPEWGSYYIIDQYLNIQRSDYTYQNLKMRETETATVYNNLHNHRISVDNGLTIAATYGRAEKKNNNEFVFYVDLKNIYEPLGSNPIFAINGITRRVYGHQLTDAPIDTYDVYYKFVFNSSVDYNPPLPVPLKQGIYLYVAEAIDKNGNILGSAIQSSGTFNTGFPKHWTKYFFNDPNPIEQVVASEYMANEKMLIKKQNPQNDKVEILSIDAWNKTNYQAEVVASFAPGTDIRLIQHQDSSELSFYGYFPDSTDLAPFVGGKGGEDHLIFGKMDQDFHIIDAYYKEIDAHVELNKIVPISNSPGQFFFVGNTSSRTFTEKPIDDWALPSEGFSDPELKNAIYGVIGENTYDYAPLISARKELVFLDIEDTDLSDQATINPSWTVLDQWLITGEKNGSLTSSASIMAYDTVDNSNGSNVSLNINRNPNKLNNPIDWSALGLNLDKVGPEKVTYFISDTKQQISVTSNWIDKISSTTVKNDNLALDAKNIHISLEAIQNGALTEERELKKKVQTLLWSLDTHQVLEDGGDESLHNNNVIFDADELSKIREATVAKPYPLTISYSDKGVSIIKRIWIFVTNPNTTVDLENNIVMYADDYSYPLHEVSNTTIDLQLKSTWNKTQPNVYAYDYLTKQIIGTELIPLASGKEGTTTGLSMRLSDFKRIQEATKEKVLSDIRFTFTKDNKIIEVPVTVTLYHEQSTITVLFEDEDHEEIHSAVEITGNVNEIIDLNQRVDIETAIQTTIDSGYVLVTSPTEQISIEINNQIVTYVFRGQLKFIDVTEKLTFSKGKILPTNQILVYESNIEDFFVRVRDTRSVNNKSRGSFKINISLTQPFISTDNKELRNVRLMFKNKLIEQHGLDITSSNHDTEEPNKTNYTFILDERTGIKDQGFSLEVPGGSAEEKDYKAVLTWDLIEGP